MRTSVEIQTQAKVLLLERGLTIQNALRELVKSGAPVLIAKKIIIDTMTECYARHIAMEGR